MLSAVRDNPQEMGKLLSAVAKNNIWEAQQIADKLGLTEERFRSEGGGIWWGIPIAIGLAVLLWTCRLPEEPV